MHIFDNDMFKLFVQGNPNVLTQFRLHSPHVWVSSVAAEESLVGRINGINRARAPRTTLSLVQAHEEFIESVEDLRLLPIFTYSEEADTVFKTFSPAQIRIGSQDCRIAAQALAHNLTVVTRNVRDFQAIGAPCAD